MLKADKVIVFDFDGVIVNSFDQLYEINRLAAERVGKNISKDEYRSLFCGNIHKKLSSIIGQDTEMQKKFNDYKYKIFSDYYNEKTIKPFNFSKEMVISLSELAEMVIISSAPENLIYSILKNSNLETKFKSISGINKNGKREMLIKTTEIAQKIYFITDTVGDISESIGLSVVTCGVTWGFHNKKMLINAGSNYVVDDFYELKEIISK